MSFRSFKNKTKKNVPPEEGLSTKITNEKLRSIHLTGIFLKIIEKLFNIKFSIKGKENIPHDKSILFLANHFTRFETIVMPYILNKIGGIKYTRSLAYKDLFIGKMGEYLTSMKVLSTGAENRDATIISDLVQKKYNWLIYPEGEMVKDKSIYTSSPSTISFPFGNKIKVRAKTGCATLLLKAEFANAIKGEIFACPISISYEPIHARHSKLYALLRRLVEKPNFPKRLKEEMYYEASLLSHSRISIEFHKAICLKDYIGENSRLLKFLPLTPALYQSWIIKSLRYPLTNYLMHLIYIKTPLTFDHFLAFTIYTYLEMGKGEISVTDLREIIFNQIGSVIINNVIKWKNRFQLSFSISSWKLPQLLVDFKDLYILNDALSTIVAKGLGFLKRDILIFNKEALLFNYDFHEIRIKNMFRVLLNEFNYFKRIKRIISGVYFLTPQEIAVENGHILKRLVELDFIEDRKKFSELKPLDIGVPIFLKGNASIGVLLCHGYKSSPAEMRFLADFLNKKGLTIYSLRLKGHGTSPDDMKSSSAEDWIFSYKIGYEILKRQCKKVYICGFSMGGLLTLINASILKPEGIITISAALKIADFKFHFTSFAKTINEILQIFSLKGKDYLETAPEYDDTNYTKHYLASLSELKKLMEMTEDALPSISLPTLVIQGKGDPTVAHRSGIEIYRKINSSQKELYEPDMGRRHVIVRGRDSEKIFQKIYAFIETHSK